jgi:hypothetical protein
MLEMFDKHYGATAGISWMVSYWVVYAIQRYGTFGAMSREARLREIGHYAVRVVSFSTAVNFGLVTGCGSRRSFRGVVCFDAHTAHWN